MIRKEEFSFYFLLHSLAGFIMNKKALALTLGSAIATVLTASPVVNAQENPFGMQEIQGAQVLAEAGTKTSEGKCGEGKCGGKAKPKDGVAKSDEKAKEGDTKSKESGASTKPETH